MPVPFVQQVEAGGEQRAADNHGDDHGDDDRVLESRGYLGFSFVGGRVRLLRLLTIGRLRRALKRTPPPQRLRRRQ